MRLIYWHQDDDPAASLSTIDEQSDSWWGGAQKSFASIALASVLAVTATSTAIAGTLVRDVEEIPARNLSTIPEDDSWSRPVLNQQAIYQKLPLGVDEDVAVTPVVSFTPDEDVGAPSVPYRSQWLIVGAFPETDEYQHVSADEDAWINPVQAYPNWQKQPFSDSDETPLLYGQYDEDFWQNPVAPRPWTIWQPLPLGDPEEIPANTLKGQADEDFWNSGVAPRALVETWPQPFSFDQSEVPQQPTSIAEEDYWQNPTAPYPAKMYQSLPYLPDPEEIPAGRLSTIPEDDSWSRPTLIAYPSFWPQQYSFDQDDLKNAAYEDDSWQPSILWAVKPIAQPSSIDDDFVSQRIVDEDVWQPRPWAIAQTTITFASDDDFVAQRPTEEDYWFRPGVTNRYANLLIRLPDEEFVRAVAGGAKLVIWIGEDVA